MTFLLVDMAQIRYSPPFVKVESGMLMTGEADLVIYVYVFICSGICSLRFKAPYTFVFLYFPQLEVTYAISEATCVASSIFDSRYVCENVFLDNNSEWASTTTICWIRIKLIRPNYINRVTLVGRCQRQAKTVTIKLDDASAQMVCTSTLILSITILSIL